MNVDSKWWRRLEVLLWTVGLCFIGVASASTVTRWQYQRQQERALFDGGPAVSAKPAPVVVADQPASAIAPRVEVAKTAPKVVERPKKHVATADPLALGRLEIPRLGLKAIVKQGDDEKTLERAVGLLPGGARPGEAGNIVLAGHRDTFFRPLQDIEVGDQIRIVEPQRTYEYRVESIRVVEPRDTSVLQSKGVEELTLVTCYPFRYVGFAPSRFIVSASRIQ